ncbi:putative membrane protein [Labilithrix luteola]|uniref:Putative membrane protein n=1 Tax=Labilithrix luteola TaxID=1391654 RepID=A0A0K1PUD6_9BACT|nr:bestrophin family protein [Labilithrix luteola]AKU97150.1 putative membrane protein [Labilithrix luteola]
MWIEKKQSWIATVILGGFALPNIWTRTLTVTGIAIAVTLLYMRIPALHYSITSTPFVLIGLPLGIFIGFRNNSAYDRFWEGRKAWGALVNTSRSITRQVLTLTEAQPDATERSEEAIRAFEVRMVHLTIAFVHTLRKQLRDSDPFPALQRILKDGEADEVERLRGEENVALAILQRLGDLLVEARRKHWIHPFHVPVIEQSLVNLTDIQGVCERIKGTPIPYSYTVLIHRIVAVYCSLLPFGLAETIGWATPAVVLCVSYALFGLDSVGDEIEQPFGIDTNDLPLKAISRNIERNLRKRLGEDLPPVVQPERGILR